MSTTKRSVKTLDSKGRVSLGTGAAGRTVQIETTDDGFVVRFCRVIPEREAWLYENEAALSRVNEGLAQAASGDIHTDVDLASFFALADSIPDDE